MTERESFNCNELKMHQYIQAKGICEVCGKQMYFGTAQLAHRIPQRKWAIEKYGKAIIHHELNLALVCSLACNSKASISNKQQEIADLVEKIKEEINGET